MSDYEGSTVPVTGSKGDTYLLTMENGSPVACTCPSFTYRGGPCKHMGNVGRRSSYVPTSRAPSYGQPSHQGSYPTHERSTTSDYLAAGWAATKHYGRRLFPVTAQAIDDARQLILRVQVVGLLVAHYAAEGANRLNSYVHGDGWGGKS